MLTAMRTSTILCLALLSGCSLYQQPVDQSPEARRQAAIYNTCNSVGQQAGAQQRAASSGYMQSMLFGRPGVYAQPVPTGAAGGLAAVQAQQNARDLCLLDHGITP